MVDDTVTLPLYSRLLLDRLPRRRRARIEELIRKQPELLDLEVGKVLKVNPMTVQAVRHELFVVRP